MPVKEKKTKAQIAMAAANASKSKKKVDLKDYVVIFLMQKWGKGKTKDKARNAVLFDEALYNKMKVDIPKTKLITPHTVSDRLKITVSLARVAIKELESEGVIRQVSQSKRSLICTRV